MVLVCVHDAMRVRDVEEKDYRSLAGLISVRPKSSPPLV